MNYYCIPMWESLPPLMYSIFLGAKFPINGFKYILSSLQLHWSLICFRFLWFISTLHRSHLAMSYNYPSVTDFSSEHKLKTASF